MTGPAPAEYGWWLASRAAGVTALVCISVAVIVGLAMGGKVARRPGWPRFLLAVHEHAALAGLVAIAVHGITLLGDGWLKAGVVDIAVPFASDHEPLWTGLGVLGGWLAVVLGLTFYARKRIGMQRWRKLHRATILVYVLSVAHTLGSGTDAQAGWMQALLLGSACPVLFLFVMRLLPAPRPLRPATAQPGSAPRTP